MYKGKNGGRSARELAPTKRQRPPQQYWNSHPQGQWSYGNCPMYAGNYNFSNTPCSYNDCQVPMDIGASHGTQPGQFTRVNAATVPPGKRACFSCRKPGHFAQNCPKYPQQHLWARYANFEAEDECPQHHHAQACGALIQEEYEGPGCNLIEEHIRSFKAMGDEECHALINCIDTSDPEDFPSAWSPWPWSGQIVWIVCTCQVDNICQSKSFSTHRTKGPKSSRYLIAVRQKTSSVKNTRSGWSYHSNNWRIPVRSTMWMAPWTKMGKSSSISTWRCKLGRIPKICSSSSQTSVSNALSWGIPGLHQYK